LISRKDGKKYTDGVRWAVWDGVCCTFQGGREIMDCCNSIFHAALKTSWVGRSASLSLSCTWMLKVSVQVVVYFWLLRD
jgi:hypothetical protein